MRLPDGMRDRIAEAAKASRRSMNAEIVARIVQSFEMDGLAGLHPAALEAAELKEAMAGLSRLLQEHKALLEPRKEGVTGEALQPPKAAGDAA